MALLGSLNCDIVRHILEVVRTCGFCLLATCVPTLNIDKIACTDQSSICNVLLTSRALHLVARGLNYYTLHLTFSIRRSIFNQSLLKLILKDSHIIASVREISIQCFSPIDSEQANELRAVFDSLSNLIPRLVGLKRVTYRVHNSFGRDALSFEESIWDHRSAIFPSLLRALNAYHPHCLLSVSFPGRVDLVSVLSYLAKSPCLYSLTVVIHDGQDLACQELFNVSSTCPRLSTLRISSGELDRQSSALYCIPLGHDYPKMRLETLELDGSFVSPSILGAEEQEVSLPDILDMSVLRNLSLTQSRHNLATAMRVENLRSLKMDLSEDIDKAVCKEALPCLFRDHALEELDLTNCLSLIDTDSLIALKHTLRVMRIHEREDETGICKRQVFSDRQIESLGEILPGLHSLGIDLNYNGGWVGHPVGAYHLQWRSLSIPIKKPRLT